MNEQLYALEEIKAYILSQNSLGDVLKIKIKVNSGFSAGKNN